MTDLAARLIAVIGGFFAWWFKELAGLVPARLRGALEGSAQAALLDLSGPEIVLSRLSGRSWRELGRVDPQGLNEPAQARAFARLIKKAKLDQLDVVLRLPASTALRKTLSLPLAAEENLRQVLTFEMDRHTPFSADEVYFDYRVRMRDAETGRMEVELVTVPRKVMDERCERAAAWGVVPDVVLPSMNNHLEIGESSLKNALPWDAISKADFKPWQDLSPYLPLIQQRSRERLADSAKFHTVSANVKTFVENRNKRKTVTTGEILSEIRGAGSEDTATADAPVPDATDATDSGSKDIYLDESTEILADYIQLARDGLPADVARQNRM
ncbi:MAG: carboxy terminal-processing peptidase [Proteobacteria bacterium]|nr:carboxy terminal-processing peptidase [Pseudomonadota bacterium]